MTTMNFGRILWWLVLVLLVLACGAAVALTIWGHCGEDRAVREILNAIHADFTKLGNSVAVDTKKLQDEYMFKEKQWYVSHGLTEGGIRLITMLFSCLGLYLFITCIVERKRRLRGLPNNADGDLVEPTEIQLPPWSKQG